MLKRKFTYRNQTIKLTYTFTIDQKIIYDLHNNNYVTQQFTDLGTPI